MTDFKGVSDQLDSIFREISNLECIVVELRIGNEIGKRFFSGECF